MSKAREACRAVAEQALEIGVVLKEAVTGPLSLAAGPPVPVMVTYDPAWRIIRVTGDFGRIAEVFKLDLNHEFVD